MHIVSIDKVKGGFEILQTSERTQTAVMILDPGKSSSEKLNTHKNSDQVLLLVEGDLLAEVDGKKRPMQKGESCLVPAGTPHRFKNEGKKAAVSFNVYSPPEYPPGKKV